MGALQGTSHKIGLTQKAVLQPFPNSRRSVDSGGEARKAAEREETSDDPDRTTTSSLRVHYGRKQMPIEWTNILLDPLQCTRGAAEVSVRSYTLCPSHLDFHILPLHIKVIFFLT
jgi:hypothetical protein